MKVNWLRKNGKPILGVWGMSIGCSAFGFNFFGNLFLIHLTSYLISRASGWEIKINTINIKYIISVGQGNL